MVETELLCLPLVKASSKEVSMKMTAAATVTLLRKGADPWLPKTVWLAPAPNAAPMSLPRPVWRRIIIISASATTTCKTESIITMCIL